LGWLVFGEAVFAHEVVPSHEQTMRVRGRFKFARTCATPVGACVSTWKRIASRDRGLLHIVPPRTRTARYVRLHQTEAIGLDGW